MYVKHRADPSIFPAEKQIPRFFRERIFITLSIRFNENYPGNGRTALYLVSRRVRCRMQPAAHLRDATFSVNTSFIIVAVLWQKHNKRRLRPADLKG